MEDTIEICSGCGKMPRMIDSSNGQFCCSRCGNRTTMHVTAANYETVVTELDQKYHQTSQQKRIEEALSTPVEISKPRAKPKSRPKSGASSRKKPKKKPKKR
jgi:hypothetical protein